MNALLFPALVPAQPAPLEKAWTSPHELLPALAARDDIRWALPETFAGRVWVGDDVTSKAADDQRGVVCVNLIILIIFCVFRPFGV